jgi:hypothetical protein
VFLAEVVFLSFVSPLNPRLTRPALFQRCSLSRVCDERGETAPLTCPRRCYDAILLSSGALVDHGEVPKKLFLEVTTSVHENEYLARILLHERGGSFGVKGISRDKKTGAILSKPHVHSNDQLATDLAGQILERLRVKSDKPYPPGTVLIINCIPNGLILDSEWKDAIERVTNARLHLGFREVFLVETVMSHSTTLYGDRKREPRRKPK